jgi:small-conductance mechanosensitive channel
MYIWDNILNHPLIDTAGFIFAPINIIIFLTIFLLGKLFLKYLKRYFKVLHIDQKQFTIEGREFALWKLIRQFVYFIVFYLCFQSLKVNNQEINFSSVFEFDFVRIGEFHISVYHLFLVVAVLFVAKLILNFLKVYLLKRVSKRNNLDKGTEYTIIQIAKYVIYTIAIIIILRSFGVQLSLFLGGATAFLLAVGLGLQDIFKDFISGLLLLFEGTTKVGDVVEIGNSSQKENAVATITEINLRTSKVKTREGKTLILPNSILTHQLVNNWSYDDTLTRFTIPVAVDYNSDIELVKELLVKCANEHPRVKNTKPVFVRLLNFGDYGLEMDLVFWADQNFEIEIYKSEIRFAIVNEFRIHNIEIPFPQHDIHMKPNNLG